MKQSTEDLKLIAQLNFYGVVGHVWLIKYDLAIFYEMILLPLGTYHIYKFFVTSVCT